MFQIMGFSYFLAKTVFRKFLPCVSLGMAPVKLTDNKSPSPSSQSSSDDLEDKKMQTVSLAIVNLWSKLLLFAKISPYPAPS